MKVRNDRMKVRIVCLAFSMCLAGVFALRLRTMVTRSNCPIETAATSWRATTSLAVAANRDVLSHPVASRELSHSSTAVAPKVLAEYGKVPMRFERNQGQTSDDVKFLSRGQGYTVFLTPTEAVMALFQSDGSAKTANSRQGQPAPEKMATALRMTLADANPAPQIDGVEELPGKSHYLVGSDPAKWRTNVPQFAKVRYRDVYKGVDVVYYGNHEQLEHDFVVAPGADPTRIRFRVTGADKLESSSGGELLLHVSGGQVRLHKPEIYQEIAGLKTEIAGGYQVQSSGEVGFVLGAYDTNQTLVIDPVLEYSTLLGGFARDRATAIAVDSAGNAYVTGFAASPDFPVTPDAFQTTLATSQPPRFQSSNAFVTKLNPQGSDLVYSTYLGGSRNDGANGIAIDSAGNAYITGLTSSPDFPTTRGVFQRILRSNVNAFVAKINPEGSALLYSTYLGGSGQDFARAIAVDGLGNAYVTGGTDSLDFPTREAFQNTYQGGFCDFTPCNNAFVTKLNPGASDLVYSTYLGGSDSDDGFGIAVDGAGNAYVTGQAMSPNFPTTLGSFQPFSHAYGFDTGNAFVTKFDPTGRNLVYSTFLGGNSSLEGDRATAIAIDGAGAAYITGLARADDFPITPGAFQTTMPSSQHDSTFVAKFNPAGSDLVYSTFLGGLGRDIGNGITVDVTGNTYVTGRTESSNFPITPDAIQTQTAGVFVTVFNPQGSDLVFSTYFGATPRSTDYGTGIAIDATGGLYVTGFSQAGFDFEERPVFPTTPGAFQTTFAGTQSFSQNTFIFKIALPAGVHAAKQKSVAEDNK